MIASTLTLTLASIVTDNEDLYVATCDAAGGKPQETLTWTLNGVEQTDGINGNEIVDTNPPATAPLSNTKSVFTFPATPENNGQTLVCQVSGHNITELNEDKSIDLDIHESAADFTVTVDYVTQGAGITVSCTALIQPSPAMRIYSIFSNGESIHESMEGVNTVSVSDPIEGTQYTCMAGNYLGNTALSAAVPYDPRRPTTPPSMTETIETERTTTSSSAYTYLKLGPSHSPIIAPENVTFFTRLGSIGRGDFGGVWKGELRSNRCLVDVAIRQIPDQVTKSKNVLQAVKVLSEVPDQPNVVKCLGYCQEQGGILYEFISGGTLLTHLQTTGVQSQPTYSNLKPKRIRIDEETNKMEFA
eukprot:XP_011676602.1 PREDICTED: protein STRUBBELIG-RECEPTOR FAMILY 6-like [Strongylocentrotus purpuratus]